MPTCVPFLKNIERGGKHAQKPSIVIVLLAFAIFFFFFVTSCHFTLLLVIVSDLELHSLASMLNRKKKHEKNMHIVKVLDFNMLTASC